jgi:hypothetical protein
VIGAIQTWLVIRGGMLRNSVATAVKDLSKLCHFVGKTAKTAGSVRFQADFACRQSSGGSPCLRVVERRTQACERWHSDRNRISNLHPMGEPQDPGTPHAY